MSVERLKLSEDNWDVVNEYLKEKKKKQNKMQNSTRKGFLEIEIGWWRIEMCQEEGKLSIHQS